MIKAGHGADPRLLQFVDDPRQVLGIDLDIAVGNDHDFVIGKAGDVGQIRNLAVATVRARSILSLMLLAGNAACKRFTSGIAASVACSTPNTVWTGAG